MSKVTFRSRAVDSNKALPVNRWRLREKPDPSDYIPITKFTSGMEKEEETEYHLQNVLTTTIQTTSESSIPTPQITKSSYYNTFYKNSFHQPKHLVLATAFSFMDDDPVDYNIDSEDENEFDFSQGNFSTKKFEYSIDKFEKGCGKQVLKIKEAKVYIRSFFEAHPSDFYVLYDYWISKRMIYPEGLLYQLKQERYDNAIKNNIDPYIAFRRRTEKMQTRKNRKADEQTFVKMFSLKRSLFNLKKIAEDIFLRETLKESIAVKDFKIAKLVMENNIYEDIKTDHFKTCDPEHVIRRVRSRLKSNKRKVNDSISNPLDDSLTSNGGSENEFEFIRYTGIKYERPIENDPLSDELPRTSIYHNKDKYSLINLENTDSHSYRQLDYMRPRFGRNNRCVFDRLENPTHAVSDVIDHINNCPSKFEPLEKRIKSDFFEYSISAVDDVNCFTLPEYHLSQFRAFSTIDNFTKKVKPKISEAIIKISDNNNFIEITKKTKSTVQNPNSSDSGTGSHPETPEEIDSKTKNGKCQSVAITAKR